MQVPGDPTDHHIHNATSFHTQQIQAPAWQLSPVYIRLALGSALVILITLRIFRYFTSELPPFGLGLKPLPGPRSTLPYIGRVHDVDRMHAWDAMHKFSKEYNGLFSCTMGGETHIWSAREDVAQDLLVKNAALSSARADLGAYPNVTQEYKYLPLMGFTDAFHRQRRFAHMMMTRNINNKYYGYMTLEMKRFMHQMLDNSLDFFELTHLFCARISSRLAYGSPESASAHKENAGTFISQLGPSGPVPNLLPPLQNLPEWLIPGKQGVRVRQEQEAKLWKELFHTSKQAYEKENGQKTYVSASLEAKESGESGRLLFENEDEARHAVGMLCIVAIFTIGGPATLFIMAMILYPEWQEKVRKEIDEAVGEGMLDLQHTPLVPTLRAAIKEAVRWKSTVPLGVPRLLTEDYKFEGYHFPKGAVVHILDIAMSQDPERYFDPASYNPGRWLDEDSPNFKAPLTEFPRLKGHHIFGRGKRACPGQDFAESELIIFCGNLLKFFTLGPARGEDGQPRWPSPDKWTTHVIGGPLPFECEIKIRDDSKLDAVRSMYAEAFPQDL